MKKVTFIQVEEWVAIYLDDKLIYWHDDPSVDAMLDMLEIKNKVLYPESLGISYDEFTSGGKFVDMPGSLEEFHKQVKQLRKKEVQVRLETAQAAARRFEQEINDIDTE